VPVPVCRCCSRWYTGVKKIRDKGSDVHSPSGVADAGCENSNCRLLKLRVPAYRDFAQGQGAEVRPGTIVALRA